MSYNPRIMQWMQPDPAGYVDGPNLRAFVGNNPINRVDPDGLKWQAVKITEDILNRDYQPTDVYYYVSNLKGSSSPTSQHGSIYSKGTWYGLCSESCW